jgi:hypothetical protein
MLRELKNNEWLRAGAQGRPVGVDRKTNVIHGFVVAQLGDFKDQGRGTFTDASLGKILELMRAEREGLKSRFSHPTLSSDGLGKFLGRAKDPFLGEATTPSGETVAAVRADLHLSESAFKTPAGNLADYVMTLAESDPNALSSSLALKTNKIEQLDAKGRPALNENGDPLPPIWIPVELHATDIVDVGAAVDGLLSAGGPMEGLPDEIVRRASQLLDTQFRGQPREVVESRCSAYLGQYLDWRYGALYEEVQDSRGPEYFQRKMRIRKIGIYFDDSKI